MPLFGDDGGKTEAATPGRISEAANKGNLPISKELTMAGTLLFALIILQSFGSWLFNALMAALSYGLDVNPSKHLLTPNPLEREDIQLGIQEEIWEMISILRAPFLTFMALFFLAVLLFGYGQIGLKYRSAALKIRFEKLHPASNIKKLLNIKSLVKTAISAAKLLVLGFVLYLVLKDRMPTFVNMYDQETTGESLEMIVEAIVAVLFWIILIVLIISLLDMMYERFNHKDGLKMTKQEVEDERKRNDGDPFVKNRLRQAAMEMMSRRMMEAVPKADVIITNPTHYSIALRYDRSLDPAPRVIAKGVDDLALKIREIATENDVPLMEDPPLARALYRAVEIDTLIPEKFYQAVAAVLSHIYRMRDEVA